MLKQGDFIGKLLFLSNDEFRAQDRAGSVLGAGDFGTEYTYHNDPNFPGDDLTWFLMESPA